MKSKTYSKLSTIKSFKERFEYLKLSGNVGEDTFGFDRYLNQKFYTSPEWKRIRNHIITRDNGCDLGIKDRPINGKIYIHHINPIDKDSIIHGDESMLDPDNLICVSSETHQAIHYGDYESISKDPIVRTKNDTSPWR